MVAFLGLIVIDVGVEKKCSLLLGVVTKVKQLC